ncbi:flagellar protein FlaG [Oxalobacteraceae bacterium GrIS 2.11]
MDINSLGSATNVAVGDVKVPVVQSGSSGSATEGIAAPVVVAQTGAPKGPVVQAGAQAGSSQQPSLEQIKQAVKDINQSFSASGQGVQFTIDQESSRVIVNVVDQKTQEVIRQIPSKELLQLSHMLDQKLGKLIHHQV